MTVLKRKLIFCVSLFCCISLFLPQTVTAAQSDRSASVVPVLKSPLGTILTGTPKFTWGKVASATHYQYQVWLRTTKLVDKTILTSACGTATCSQKPSLSLGQDVYKWRARAKLNGVWKAWATYVVFEVSAKPFFTGFANSASGWKLLPKASYWQTDASTLFTHGWGSHVVSAYKENARYFNFDYSARLKITGDPYGLSMGILFRASGNLLPANGQWYPGYAFQVTQTGDYRVVKFDDDGNAVPLVNWTIIPTDWVINISDWNTYRVVAYGDAFLIYLNNKLLVIVTDDSYSSGYVGFSMAYYAYGSTEPTFSADWAKVKVIGRFSPKPVDLP